MIIRINDMLKARREGLKKDEGFSLIELLVVVIIIGILAAIAIPIYIGVQNNAKDSAVRSDLTNAKNAVVAYYTQNSAMPTATQLGDKSTLATLGWSGTNVTYVSSTAANNFCLQATAGSDATKKFYVTTSGGVVATAVATVPTADCP